MSAGLEENLLALTRFDYPNYEIYFTLATSLDPALKVIERVKAASQKPVHIVIAGPPTDCGEKVYNLQRAVEALARRQIRNARIYGFRRAPAARLAHQADRSAATTAASAPPRPIAGLFPADREWNRWRAASLRPGTARSPPCWANPSGNFCWGGGTAIRRKTFDDVNVLEAWKGAVSDDFAMTYALEQAGKAHRFLSGMSRRHAASLDLRGAAGIHQPADSDHARLFAAPLAIGRHRAFELLAHAAVTRCT